MVKLFKCLNGIVKIIQLFKECAYSISNSQGKDKVLTSL